MFDSVDSPSLAREQGDFRTWQTVASCDMPGPPQAIGVITKTWNPILCEGLFLSFETREREHNSALPLFPIRSVLTPGPKYSGLPAGSLVGDFPRPGTVLRRGGVGAVLGVPYSTAYDHWVGVDQAPKLLTRAPENDFAFGVTAKVYRSLFSPVAAGAAVGTTMWGTEHSADIRDGGCS